MNNETIKNLQADLGVIADGVWGPKSQAALDTILHPDTVLNLLPDEHLVKASSFADPKDIAAFKKCKAQGNSDTECFKVGDNGIGCWGDDVTVGLPYVALPPEDMIEKWGSTANAKHKQVLVKANGREVIATLGDRMPHRANIHNGCGIDLAPLACEALHLHQPVMTQATWSWV